MKPIITAVALLHARHAGNGKSIHDPRQLQKARRLRLSRDGRISTGSWRLTDLVDDMDSSSVTRSARARANRKSELLQGHHDYHRARRRG